MRIKQHGQVQLSTDRRPRAIAYVGGRFIFPTITIVASALSGAASVAVKRVVRRKADVSPI